MTRNVPVDSGTTGRSGWATAAPEVKARARLSKAARRRDRGRIAERGSSVEVAGNIIGAPRGKVLERYTSRRAPPSGRMPSVRDHARADPPVEREPRPDGAHHVGAAVES